VHSTFEDIGGYDCTVIYFTVDRGFSFTMPVPGDRWRTTDVPHAAERLHDEYDSPSFKIEGSWPSMGFIPEASTKIDTIKRIKQRTIAGAYCRKMDEELGFHEPDDALLVFDDGSQAYCVTVAPHGTGATGLHYLTESDRLLKPGDLVDFFEVPLEKKSDKEAGA
jgi:hypothetical protein